MSSGDFLPLVRNDDLLRKRQATPPLLITHGAEMRLLTTESIAQGGIVHAQIHVMAKWAALYGKMRQFQRAAAGVFLKSVWYASLAHSVSLRQRLAAQLYRVADSGQREPA